MKKLIILFSVLLFGFTIKTYSKPIPITGFEVIKMMHDKYTNGKWYKTLSFSQTTNFFEDGEIKKKEIWHEIMASPGRLHIRYEDFKSGSGMIFYNDSMFTFENFKLVAKQRLIHDLIVLSNDVYHQPIEKTYQQLKELEYNLGYCYKDSINGRAVYVIGRREKQEDYNYFVIDAENLYFVKMYKKRAKYVREIEFNKYVNIDGFWVESFITFYKDGKIDTTEEYYDIKANIPVDTNVFIPENFAKIKNW